MVVVVVVVAVVMVVAVAVVAVVVMVVVSLIMGGSRAIHHYGLKVNQAGREVGYTCGHGHCIEELVGG